MGRRELLAGGAIFFLTGSRHEIWMLPQRNLCLLFPPRVTLTSRHVTSFAPTRVNLLTRDPRITFPRFSLVSSRWDSRWGSRVKFYRPFTLGGTLNCALIGGKFHNAHLLSWRRVLWSRCSPNDWQLSVFWRQLLWSWPRNFLAGLFVENAGCFSSDQRRFKGQVAPFQKYQDCDISWSRTFSGISPVNFV